jgi:tetratricopeptide (TPR) repeat protein
MRRQVLLSLFVCVLGVAAGQDTPQQAVAQWMNGALQALEKGQFEKAESELRRALAASLDQLGAINESLGAFRRAEAAYSEAVRATAAPIRPLLGLTVVYLRTGRYDEGIVTVEQALALDVMNAEARQLLGKLHFMKGQFAAAAQELGRAYQVDPENARVGYTLALALLKLRRLEEARGLFAGLASKLGDSAGLHVLFGRALRETDYLDDAVAEFKRAVELDTKTHRAHYYLGITYLLHEGAGAFASARGEFEAELAVYPNEYFAHLLLGVILLQERQNEAAAQHLVRAAELNANLPESFLFLGQARYQMGDMPGAISSLRKAIELTDDPGRGRYQIANGHFMLGQALRRSGQPAEAAEHLKRSQELKSLKAKAAIRPELAAGEKGEGQEAVPPGPLAVQELAGLAQDTEPAAVVGSDPPDEKTRKALENTSVFYSGAAANAYVMLARMETARSGNFKKAAEYLENATRWDDSLPDLYFNLGLARLKAEEWGPAASSLLEALKRSPGKQETRALLASVALQMVDQRLADAALEVTATLLDASPNVPDLYVLRGRAFSQKGKWDEALEQFRVALQKAPDLPDAHYLSGAVLIRRGELERAREEFDKELSRDPRHVRALYHKGFVLASLRNIDEAVPLLEQVTRLDPKYGDAYYQLGKIQLEKNETLFALMNLEVASTLNPEASYVWYQLSRAYTKAGRRDDAQQALERYRAAKRTEAEARSRRNELVNEAMGDSAAPAPE